MSDYFVIGDIFDALIEILENDPWTGVDGNPEITMVPPVELKDDKNRICLFLYSITENSYYKNEQPHNPKVMAWFTYNNFNSRK